MDAERTLNVTPTTHPESLLVGDLTAQAFPEAGYFLRLARLLASTPRDERQFQALYQLLREVVPLDRIALVLFDPADRPSVSAYPKTEPTHSTLDDFDCYIARAVQALQRDKFAAPLIAPLDLETLRMGAPSPVHSILAVPLWEQGIFAGALVAEAHRAKVKFTKQHQEIILSAAQLFTLTLEREAALQAARKKTDQMAAFSTVASTVNEWVSVEQLARRFLAVFLNTTGTEHGLFYLLNDEAELSLVGHFGSPPGLVDALVGGHPALNAELRTVVETGHLVVLQDQAQAGVSAHSHALPRVMHVDSLLLLPLRVKGQVIGIVSLGKREGVIDLPDHEFIQGLADQAAQAIENARLFTEAERRFAEQSTLRGLAQWFLGAVSPEDVLEQTLDTLAELIPSEYYEVLLPDNHGGFTLVNGRGWRRGTVGRTRVPDTALLHAGYVVRVQSPVVIENFATENRFQPADYLVRHQVSAGMCAPMVAETRVIGLLGVYSRTARLFTGEKAQFLYLLATQTAIALEKARHSHEATRRLDELILLNDVIVAANSEVSLERVLEGVTAEIGKLLQSDDVHVTFAPENSDDDRRVTLTSAPAGWGDPVAKWVMESHNPLLVQDLTHDDRFPTVMSTARACLAAPMAIGDSVIGVIAVAHPESNYYGRHDLRLLTTLAGQIAAAIARVRLLDETRRRLAEISAMFEYSNALRTATGESDLLEVVVRHATTILQSTGGSLQLLAEKEKTL